MSDIARKGSEAEEWWRGAIIYEVYVRSFRDCDGDGEGDLAGVIEGLDYLASLGIDAIWLTPVSPSPNHDSGYDVSDYYGIEPAFGTIEEFRALVSAAHRRGLRVVLDQVYSHSSHLHPWFVESASSRDNPKADWYVWADPRADGGPPNNWLGRFGGYAWEWSPVRGQYYLHNFLIEQPDLNLHNPEVQDEIVAIMRHWFALGVDGLRLDVVNFYMHDPALRNNPPARRNAPVANPYYLQAHVYDRSRPENLGFVERIRAVADEAGARMLLGEISCDNQVARMAEYTRPGRLHTAYSFELLGAGPSGRHIAASVEQAGEDGAWPCWAFSNHDVQRVATRWAGGEAGRARLFLALLMTLRGSIALYQGEELGLTHSDVPRARLRDPEAIRFWPNHRGRDGARTPMPWQPQGVSLGFSPVDGWLPAEPAHAGLAVAVQEQDQTSTLAHARAMIALRRTLPALRLGTWETIAATEDSLIFRRRLGTESVVCAFNWGGAGLEFSFEGELLAGRADGGFIGNDSFAIVRESS